MGISRAVAGEPCAIVTFKCTIAQFGHALATPLTSIFSVFKLKLLYLILPVTFSGHMAIG